MAGTTMAIAAAIATASVTALLGCGTATVAPASVAVTGAAPATVPAGTARPPAAIGGNAGTPSVAVAHAGPVLMSSADLDRLMVELWRQAGVSPAAAADDSEYLRRVMLDVAGRIPTLDETERFLADQGPRKRERLVDAQLAGPAYPEHFADLYMDLFIGQQFRKPRLEKVLDPHGYFAAAFRDNKRFDQLARELLTFSGEMQRGGPGVFLASHLKGGGPEMAASAAARLFLGVQIQCAQCHDHPYDPRYKQEDFYGLVAYFVRTKQKEEKVTAPAAAKPDTAKPDTAKPEAVKSEAMRADTTTPDAPPTDAMTKDPSMVAATAAATAAAASTDDKIYSVFDKPGGQAKFKRAGATEDTVVRPRFLGRPVAPLADEALRQTLARAIIGSDLFAKTVVDRTWAQLFGRGIVEPWDDLGGERDPRHPVLLDRLAADFQASGYDFKHLLRVILLSRAYGLTSRSSPTPTPPPPLTTQSSPPPPSTTPETVAPTPTPAPPPAPVDPTATFARATVRRLTPEQLFQSLLVATGAEHVEAKGADTIEKKIERAMREYLFVFGDDEMAEINTFNGNIPQSLLLLNGEIVNQGAKARPRSTLAMILDASADPAIRLRKMFLVAYARPPTEAEAARLLPALAAAKAARGAYEDVFFALLTSTEMLTVH